MKKRVLSMVMYLLSCSILFPLYSQWTGGNFVSPVRLSTPGDTL
ncbi:MAG: hypothetical protein N2053_02625 [Chitinispirillaceae bacterium]|nr:hypothetical protein [Chitinispirillaceae bacterium]